MTRFASRGTKRNVRAADAKEVGVGNPAEETCCHPNIMNLGHRSQTCQQRIPRNASPLFPVELGCGEAPNDTMPPRSNIPLHRQ